MQGLCRSIPLVGLTFTEYLMCVGFPFSCHFIYFSFITCLCWWHDVLTPAHQSRPFCLAQSVGLDKLAVPHLVSFPLICDMRVVWKFIFPQLIKSPSNPCSLTFPLCWTKALWRSWCLRATTVRVASSDDLNKAYWTMGESTRCA